MSARIGIGAVSLSSMYRHPELARIALSSRVHRPHHHDRVVCWRRFGDGPPIVLLHGGHGGWLHWVRNVEALAAHHAVWVPDMPGFGESDDLEGAPHAQDRLARLVDSLAVTLDSLIGESSAIGLCGFSFGGLAAAHLAARRGGVERMVLIAPGGHGAARRERESMIDWRFDDERLRHDALRHNLRVFMLHDPARIDDVALAVHEACCLRTRFRSKSLSRGGLLQAALAARAIPTLMIWGEHDVTADPGAVGAALCADASRRWNVIPDAGHWVQFEQAGAVNDTLLREFRESRDSVPSAA